MKEKFIFITLFGLPILPIWYAGPVLTDMYEVYLYKRDSYWYESIVYLALGWGFSFMVLIIFSILLELFTGTSIDDYKICRFGRC